MQTFYKICLLLLIVGGTVARLVPVPTLWAGCWAAAPLVWSRIVFALVGLAALVPSRRCSARNRRKNNENGCCTKACNSRFQVIKSSENIKYFRVAYWSLSTSSQPM